MSDSILDLIFTADTKQLDEAKEKLVDLGGHIPSVGEGIEKLAESFKNIPGPVGLAAAAFVGFGLGLVKMLESTIEAETQLLELSEAMGVPVEKAQPFIEAMALSGVAAEKLQGSMGKLAVAVGNALSEPTGKAADAFRKLGVSQKELASGDTEQILKDVAAGFDKYADSATKTAAIRETLGKQGPAIIAAMKDEAEMAKMAADAEEQYGTKVSEADAKSSKYFGETLKLGMTMFEGVAMSVTKSLLPGLQTLVDQFAESGKQGGVMRDVLDGLSWTISNVSKVIITLLVEPVRFAIEVFKEAGTAIGASMAAIGAAAHGHLGEAKQIMTDMSNDLVTMTKQYEESSAKFVDALWNGTTAVKDQGDALDANKPKFEAYNAGASKVADTLAKLRAELEAQLTIQKAAAQGLAEYKAAQDDVATATLRLTLAKEGASKADIAAAVALKQRADASKSVTTDEVAGWNLINRLAAENIGLTTHQTELQKTLAEIAKSPGMSDSERAVATALAASNEQLKQQEELKKEVATMDQEVNKDNQTAIASMTLGTNQLKLFNEQLKLRATYEKALLKDPANEAQLTAAFQKDKEAIDANNASTLAFTQSLQGMGAGGMKAMQDLQASTTNLNTIGFQATTTFTNNLTTAFMKMGSNGKDAFKDLAVAMLQFFEQLIVKWAVVQAMTAALEAMGVSGAAVSAILTGGGAVTKSANGNAFSGGSLTAFADGGVIGGPMIAPMALMGEAGPEAIMPLQRNAAGQLGVSVSGNGGTSGGVTHNHNHIITINSNQDPHSIAKETAKQINVAKNFTRNTIANEQRPGGMLHNRSQAFA